jgi:hypothetical protein
MSLTTLEQAELLVQADPQPIDIREKLQALEKEADPITERPMFAELWEILDVAANENLNAN